MEKLVSQFSVEFREVMIKVIKEDYYLKNKTEKIDPIQLTERYKTILDNINGFVLISNYTTWMYEYVSSGVYTHLGYDVTGYNSAALTDFMISIIQDNHRDFMVNSLLPTVLKYLKEHSTQATGTDYRYTCCLKLRNVYGIYQWYLVDTVLIEVDDTGFPVRTLVTATNIHQFKKDDCVYYNVIKKNSDGVYEVMLEGASDKEIKELKLTPREIQIINLIAQGSSNKQIADKLFITLNTVQTHRKSIMRKTKCSGTAELTNFAFSRGLL
jgi:DNA-binding CsgD family transcriptional regulator